MRRFLTSLVIGALIGMAVGVYLAWVQFPVQTIDSPMRSLAPADKERYTIMIAEGYELDGDANEAIRRLAAIGVIDAPPYVRDVTERFISTSGTGRESDIRHLVALAGALGVLTPPMQGFLGTAPTPPPSAP